MPDIEITANLKPELRLIDGKFTVFINDKEWAVKPEIDYKSKYDKCIEVIKRLDAGIISMYDL